MCMDEFVKRLYDFMGIYKNFWSQNSDYRYLPIFYRYLPIFYRYFTDIYRYFFKNSCTSARAPQSRFFGGKIGFFQFFGKKSAILSIFPLIDFSSDFSSRCRPKTDFSAKYRPKKPIFRFLLVSTTELIQDLYLFYGYGSTRKYYRAYTGLTLILRIREYS